MKWPILICLSFMCMKADPGCCLQVTITDVKSSEGTVRICLFDNEEGFPAKYEEAKAIKVVDAEKDLVTFEFKDIEPGEYSISIYHDANNNNKLDKGIFGIPKEGFGFSNDAKVKTGPPKYKATTFTVSDQPKQAISIKMRYF